MRLTLINLELTLGISSSYEIPTKANDALHKSASVVFPAS
jgi:hypothetical protein